MPDEPLGGAAREQYQDALAYRSRFSYDLCDNASTSVDHEPWSIDPDNTTILAIPQLPFDEPVFFNSEFSPHPLPAKSKFNPGLEGALSKPDSSSAMSSRVEKRKANTLAARRYRQNRLDKVAGLESALKATQLERDALKVQVAKLEGETQVLREIIGERMESC